jgi:hypothetical protein
VKPQGCQRQSHFAAAISSSAPAEKKLSTIPAELLKNDFGLHSY